MADGVDNAVQDDDLFIFQNQSAASSKMKVVDAKTLQNYFSEIDMTGTDANTEFTLLFTDSTQSDGTTAGRTINFNSDGSSDLAYNPSTNLLRLKGSMQLMDDAVTLSLGADQDVILTHVADTGLLLSGSTGAEKIQFRDSTLTIGSSADGQLDLAADVELQVVAPTIDLDASTAFTLDGGDVTISGAAHSITSTTYSLDASSAITLDSDAAVTIGGAGVDIDADGSSKVTIDGAGGIDIGVNADVAVDIDAAALTMNASGEMSIEGEAGVLLHSSEASADAVIIKASATSGGIDLIASGSNVALSLDANSADFGTEIQVNVDSTTESSGTDSGALVVDGGVGIAKNLNVGGSGSISGDLTVTGDFSVLGQTTTIDTVNLLVEDPFVVMAKNVSGTPAMDQGFMFERGTSDNSAIIWDESAGQFAFIQTNSSHEVQGNVDIADYYGIRVGGLTVDDNATVAGTLDVTGRTSLSGAVDLGDGASDAISVLGTATFTPTADFDAGLTAAAGQSVSGDGELTVTAAGQLNLDATAGKIQLSASAGLELESVPQAIIDLDADFMYFADDSDSGLVKKELVSDMLQLAKGDGIQVADTGLISIAPVEEAFRSTDRSGAAFTLSDSYSTQILQETFAVYLNGQLLVNGNLANTSGISDYTVSGDQLTMAEAVTDTNDVVIVRYIKK